MLIGPKGVKEKALKRLSLKEGRERISGVLTF